MRSVLLTCTLLLTACTAFAQNADTAPLTALVGHWEGGGTFNKTAMSEAGAVKSTTDCAWSPQQRYLVCEQTITQDKTISAQLAIYTPSAGQDFRFYRVSGSGNPYAGKVTIKGSTWVYDDVVNDGKTEIRTTNTFTGDEEVFKTEFSTDGGPWTTMLEGKLHRAKK